MNLSRAYRRSGASGVELLTVMAYLGVEDPDGDEIRVIHTVDGRVTEDGIAFHGEDGGQWLQNQHVAWTEAGYELVAGDAVA
ncbi:hypothetical protein [Micromonospora chokoriensis]|uniref:Uncharacterized protein n=1 Tax=Micromonospora chokoriensis TaxID=356851 RepID=A0A1C4Y7N3_9ACTN|nr:hypothetical protein [Micromonospora chokoriensis]SCF16725.1 hypothetical protein GA0070612_4389 [Micromonospora chokoriensis]